MSTFCVTVTWLSKTDLSNINSGEGGGGNVVELKTYRSGRRPYASGAGISALPLAALGGATRLG